MAARNDTFLSDVHLCSPFLRTSKKNVAITRFKIIKYSECRELNSTEEVRNIHEVQDGDLSPPRKQVAQDDCSDVITIGQPLPKQWYNRNNGRNKWHRFNGKSHVLHTTEHHLSTRIEDVGLQVWRGALLLCDFVIHNKERFDGCVVLELGAGLGLCSIVLGRVAKRVFCTDVGENVLEGCQENITMNSHLFKYGSDVVLVRELDWLKHEICTAPGEGAFCWTKEDKDVLKEVSVILAADVIYDDSLTDAFIETVLRFLEATTQVVLFLAIEKRVNFRLEDLAVSSPAYNHFRRRIEKLENMEQRLKARKLNTDFPKYLHYERVKELELWEIKPT